MHDVDEAASEREAVSHTVVEVWKTRRTAGKLDGEWGRDRKGMGMDRVLVWYQAYRVVCKAVPELFIYKDSNRGKN
jgi:hypothetical protein